MSAGTLAFEQDKGPSSRPSTRAGYTSISAGTMHHLVAAIAAEAFNIPVRDVRAGIRDEQGQVSVSLAVPLVLGVAGKLATFDGGTVFERAGSARVVVASRIQALAGTVVGRVDVRFTGIHNGKQANGKQATAGRVQ